MRKLATAASAFAAGIFLAQYLLPLKWQIPLCAAFLAIGCVGFWKRGTPRLRIFLIAAGLASSMAYNWAYTTAVQAPAERLAGTEPSSVSMTLCNYAAATKYGAKVTVRLYIQGRRPVKAVYYGDKDLLSLSPGNTVTGDVTLHSASKIKDDDVTAFTSKGVLLLAYSHGEATAERGSAASPLWWPIRFGHAMQAQIKLLFGGDIAGFLTAILTGDKTILSVDASSDLSEAGMFHILAVSGMHCSYLLAMVMFLTGRQRRRLAACIAIPLLVFYALLAGCTPSVVRACIMLFFLLLAPLFRRERDFSTALAAALALILLKNPFAAASVSLQLSFAAMAGILWLTPKLSGALLGGKQHSRPIQFLTASFSATLGALVFTVPLTAVYFNILVLVSPLSNLVCLWAASFAFCLGLLSVLGSMIWFPLGRILGLVPHAFIWYILRAAHLLAKIPYHALYFSNPYLKYWLVFLYLLFALAYCLKSGTRRKYILSAGLAMLTMAVTVRLGTLRYTCDKLDITVLNVGQGQSVLLSSGGAFALIDCGSGNSWYDAGEIAADSLESRGCSELQYLLLTHYDYDHVCGVMDLFSRVEVDRLVVPDTEDDSGLRDVVLTSAEQHGVPVEFVTKKTTARLGDATLTTYPPLGKEGDNERGLTFLCTAGDYDFLVTGDMDSTTERELLAAYSLPDIEAMMVGHHGSKYSTSEDLLKALKPEIGIISVGSNSYGHPADQTLRRLEAAGVTIYRTDLQGTIHLCVN